MRYILYYIVYLTTNLVNEKIYIGVHATENPAVFDGYLGSGKILLLAKNKHGKDQFIRETLFTYETSEEAYLKEKEIVNKEFIEREDTYNLVLGGDGYAGGEDHPMYGKRGKDAVNFGRLPSPTTKKKISVVNMGHIVLEETKKKIRDTLKGNHHSEERKKNIGEAKRLSPEIVEQRRNDIKEIPHVNGWKSRLAEKWDMSCSNVCSFLKIYAQDLVRDVVTQRRKDIKELSHVYGWKAKLAIKWSMSHAGVRMFIQAHAFDLVDVREVRNVI